MGQKRKNKKPAVDKERLQKMIQDWRGEGKIQAKRRQRMDDGTYRLDYVNEKGNSHWILLDSKKEVDEILIEFGGKNHETVAAPNLFMSLGGWVNEDLEQLGHRIEKVTISSESKTPASNEEICFPEDCGNTEIRNAQNVVKREANVTINRETGHTDGIGARTVSFSSPHEFENFVEFLLSHKKLKHLKFHVKRLTTLSVDTRKVCSWERQKAKDGTARMELMLVSLDGVPYEDCVHYELIEAADGMAAFECAKVTDTTQKEQTKKACIRAVERGDVII